MSAKFAKSDKKGDIYMTGEWLTGTLSSVSSIVSVVVDTIANNALLSLFAVIPAFIGGVAIVRKLVGRM